MSLRLSFIWESCCQSPQATYPGNVEPTFIWREARIFLCLVLLRMGFAEPPCRQDAGELLPHRFILTATMINSWWVGGLLSVALSVGSPRLAVSQHSALWSPDFPRPDKLLTCPGATAHVTGDQANTLLTGRNVRGGYFKVNYII